jgi:hypothetical protein
MLLKKGMESNSFTEKVANKSDCDKKSFLSKNCYACPPIRCCGLMGIACTAGVAALLATIVAYGISVETANMGKARSTLSYFNLDSVCALDNTTGMYSKFENRQ